MHWENILNLSGYWNIQSKMTMILEDSKHHCDQLLEWGHMVSGNMATPYLTVCLLVLQVCQGLPQDVHI